MKEEPTLSDILSAVSNGVTATEKRLADVATKDDHKVVEARLAAVEADVKTIKADVAKIRDTFAPRLEFDDRLTCNRAASRRCQYAVTSRFAPGNRAAMLGFLPSGVRGG